MSNWEEGNYGAVTKAATVYEKEGKLLLAVAFDVSGNELKSYFLLVQADGTVNTNTIKKLKEWSGWDGVDPYWFVDNASGGIVCEVVIKMEPGFKEKDKLFPKIAWVNKAGSSGGAAMPEMADRRAVLSKYGAKFRAIGGPQPMGAQTKPQGATPPQRPQTATPPQQPPTRPQATAAHATLEECWRLMQQHNQKLKPEQVTEKWYGFIDATGMDQADMTPEGWDKVKASILSENPIGDVEEEGEPIPF